MIHKRYKIVTLLLICILLINFIIEPKQKANSVGASIGAIYGTAYGTKLLAFLYACIAAGVTFNALEDAQAMFDKWQIDSNNWEPPQDDPDGPNGWKQAILALLAGMSLSNSVNNLIDNIKDWFQSIGSEEGANVYGDGIIYKYGDYSFSLYIYQASTYRYWSIMTNSGKGYGFYSGANRVVGWNPNTSNPLPKPDIEYNIYGNNIVFKVKNTQYQTIQIPISGSHSMEIQDDNNYYNVQPNSYVTTAPSPTRTQPDIKILPLEPTVDSGGNDKLVYVGTMEDMADDYVDSVTWEDIIADSIKTQSGTAKPYTLTETQSGVEVQIDEKTGTIPTPYPDINIDPIEDVAEYQGKSIGLLQSIVNWLKLIYEIPLKLFEIPEGLEIDISNLRLGDFQRKFPFSIPWDLYKSINVFAKQPTEPDLTINIDTEYVDVNHTIDISTIELPLLFARYSVTIFFIIFLAGKTRDLIKW